MSDVTTTYNTQGSWEAGDIVGLTAYDPAGKLIPSVDTDEIASIYDNYSLAVYARIRDGTGTSIASLGQQATGTLTGGAWAARTDDGRAYLTGGSISFAYHASMAKADVDGKKQAQGGGIRFKLSSVTAQVLMTRAGRFSLGIDANSLPYFSWVHSAGTQTITAAVGYAIVADTPTVLHFSATGGAAYLYKDGVLVASVTGLTGKNDPGSGALVVACTGIYSDVFLVGEYYNSGMLASQRYSGTWEEVVDLGAGKDQTLRYFTIVSKKKFNHSISISVSFAATEATIDDARVYSFSVDQFETEKFHAPETTLSHGRYMKVQLSLSGRNFDYQLPIVDSLVLVTRDVGTVTYEQGDLDFGDFLLPDPDEAQTPEDLSGALAELARLRATVTEIKQIQGRFGSLISRHGAAIAQLNADLAWQLGAPELTTIDLYDGVSATNRRGFVWKNGDIASLGRAVQGACDYIYDWAARAYNLAAAAATQSWVSASFATSSAESTANASAANSAAAAHNASSSAHSELVTNNTFAHSVFASAMIVMNAATSTADSKAVVASTAASTAAAAAADAHSDASTAYTLADAALTSAEVSSAIAAHNASSFAHSELAADNASAHSTIVSILTDVSSAASTAIVNASSALSRANSAYALADAAQTSSEVSTAIDNHNTAAAAHSSAAAAYALADAAQTSAEVSSAIATHNTAATPHTGKFDAAGAAAAARLAHEGYCGAFTPP